MKKMVLALIIVFLALFVAYFIRVSPSGNVIDNGGNGEELSGITLDALAKHNTENDCWVAYNDKVYDITSWLPVHPGSAAAIAPYCGTYDEFTSAFTQKHGTSKISMLMKIGTLMGDFEIQGEVQ